MLKLIVVPLKTQFPEMNIIFRIEMQCKLGEVIIFWYNQKGIHYVKENVPSRAKGNTIRKIEKQRGFSAFTLLTEILMFIFKIKT